MATHYSKTRGAKSSNDKIVVPSWDSMWESFDDHNQKTTIEAMNAEGWRTVDQVIQKTGLSSPRIYNMVREGKFETVKKKVFYAGKTRDIKFVRPKIDH
jgi:hypothetical protein